ncbi:NAD-binding protein, partial [bacterium]|nr:NAD-binding protein [bacterium]
MKVAVVGGGTMGNGIVHTFAQFGNEVTLIDVSEDALQRGVGFIEKNLGRMVKKEKISQQVMDDTLGRISTATELSSAADADLVVEAVFE